MRSGSGEMIKKESVRAEKRTVNAAENVMNA